MPKNRKDRRISLSPAERVRLEALARLSHEETHNSSKVYASKQARTVLLHVDGYTVREIQAVTGDSDKAHVARLYAYLDDHPESRGTEEINRRKREPEKQWIDTQTAAAYLGLSDRPRMVLLLAHCGMIEFRRKDGHMQGSRVEQEEDNEFLASSVYSFGRRETPK